MLLSPPSPWANILHMFSQIISSVSTPYIVINSQVSSPWAVRQRLNKLQKAAAWMCWMSGACSAMPCRIVYLKRSGKGWWRIPPYRRSSPKILRCRPGRAFVLKICGLPQHRFRLQLFDQLAVILGWLPQTVPAMMKWPNSQEPNHAVGPIPQEYTSLTQHMSGFLSCE